MHKDACLTCAFFHQWPAFEKGDYVVRCELGNGGECRAYPPDVPLTHRGRHNDYGLGVWPVVFASSWCGQYRRRSAPLGRPVVPVAEASEV